MRLGDDGFPVDMSQTAQNAFGPSPDSGFTIPSAAAGTSMAPSPGQTSFLDTFNFSDILSTGLKTWGAVTVAKSQAGAVKAAAQAGYSPSIYGSTTGGIRNPLTGKIDYTIRPPVDYGNLPVYAGIGAAVLVVLYMMSGSGRQRR